MEVLAHINKRVRSMPTLRLPCNELAAVVTQGDVMRTNFACMYLGMGVERLTPAEQKALVPVLLKGFARLTTHVADKVCHGLVPVPRAVLSLGRVSSRRCGVSWGCVLHARGLHVHWGCASAPRVRWVDHGAGDHDAAPLSERRPGRRRPSCVGVVPICC